ncbi:MAG TPA: twin-arginine translocase subunit TatC [Mycobacteriales bacterium]|nr:twin-arginine translocase subunit TatC [Mycobacteriales bacterium]
MRMPRPTRSGIDTSPDGRMSLEHHLKELRYRVCVSLAAVVVGTIVAYVFHGTVMHVITKPYCGLPDNYRLVHDRCTLFVSGVLDAFTVTLKLSLYAGVVLSSPVWLFQIWRYITPGLYAHERRYAVTFVAASMSLFALGGAFAWLTLGKGLHFLLSFATGTNGISALLSFTSYLSFVVAMILIFAVSFEFPLVVVMLNRVGVLSAERLRKWSRGIVFGIFVFAAVATPSQDPFTMSALAVPMVVLFGVAVGLATLHDHKQTRIRAASPDADLADDELSSLPADDDLRV